MSHRGDLTGRLVELLLLLTERAFSQRELVGHFNVDRKTVKRAVDALSIHFPIIEEPDGREVRYRLSDEYRFAPPTFTPSELAVLLLAQESIAGTGISASGTPFAEHARRMFVKVRAALPAAVRDKLDSLAVVYGTSAVPAKDFAPHASTVEKLTEAAVEQRRVKLRYYSLTDARVKERLVDPYCVYFDPDGATLKLIGLDHLRRAVIPFAVDHIRSLRLTDERFERPRDFNLRDYLSRHCFNGIHGDPVTVRLRARGMTARVFAERQFHPSQRVVPPESGMPSPEETTIEMRVARGRGLERFILSWAPDVEVISPDWLRRAIAETHRRALRHYFTPGDDD